MKKYKYIKAHTDYELKVILDCIEENNHKLISVASFNNCIYVFYEIVG